MVMRYISMKPLMGSNEERAVAVICFMIASSICRFELSSCAISLNSPVAGFSSFRTMQRKRGQEREREREAERDTDLGELRLPRLGPRRGFLWFSGPRCKTVFAA